MWFASIWIFTLQLPWQLGADFFFQHLLDADAASNTLSWRWVAGLHTKGKHYLARADNIATFTKGRFDPRGQLNETAQPLIDPHPYPSPLPLAHATDIVGDRIGLLVTQDDLNPLFVRDKAKVAALALAQWEEGTSPPDPNTPKARFNTGAWADAQARLQAEFDCPCVSLSSTQALTDWAKSLSVQTIATPHVCQGPTRAMFEAALAALKSQSIHLIPLQNPHDQKIWPHCTAGFFKLKAQIPKFLTDL
jgi:deoxyribodipyrimidine photo-lyase